MTSKNISRLSLLLMVLAPLAWGASSNIRKLQGASVVNGSGVLGIHSSGTVTIPNGSGTVVVKDGSGNFSATTITANVTGTASGNLQATPNQYGVVVSGSGNTATVIAPDASTTKVLTSGGTGASPTWQDTASAPTAAYELSNVGIAASVAGNALTIALKQNDGSTNCSTGSAACKIGVGSSTVQGSYNQRSVTSALSITVPSGATLGTTNAIENSVYAYVADTNGSGLMKACVAGAILDEALLYTSTAISGGSSRSDTLYCDAVYSAKIRLLGRVTSTQATAGTWATSPSRTSTVPFQPDRWYVDASVSGGTPDIGAIDVSSYVEIANSALTLTTNAGSIPVNIACSTTNASTGATCSSGNETLGISFVPPTSGRVNVCADFTVNVDVGAASGSGNAFPTFKLVRTGNSDQTVAADGGYFAHVGGAVYSATARVSFHNQVKLCGKFQVTAQTQTTIRVFYVQEVTSTVNGVFIVGSGGGGTSGGENVHWSVEPIF